MYPALRGAVSAPSVIRGRCCAPLLPAIAVPAPKEDADRPGKWWLLDFAERKSGRDRKNLVRFQLFAEPSRDRAASAVPPPKSFEKSIMADSRHAVRSCASVRRAAAPPRRLREDQRVVSGGLVYEAVSLEPSNASG